MGIGTDEKMRTPILDLGYSTIERRLLLHCRFRMPMQLPIYPYSLVDCIGVVVLHSFTELQLRSKLSLQKISYRLQLIG